MIGFDGVAITYPGAARPALADVSLHVPEGELCLVVGPTGSGKSTLLRAVNGLVPWFTGGSLEGRVTVGGRSTADHSPRELAELVGVVVQDPAAGFVADVVEDELAYTMENLGVAPDTMRQRVEEVVDLLGLQDVRQRPLADLSSGQQQRVAIGSVLAAAPRVLVLDEPTSALDPGAAEEVLAAVTRLVHDLGLTVLLAEHRLERVVQYADRVVVLRDGRVVDGAPEAMMADAPVAPPVVELGRLAGWSPLPLSVRDARRLAGALRDDLGPGPRSGRDDLGPGPGSARGEGETGPGSGRGAVDASPTSPADGGDPLAEVEGTVVRYGPVTALAGIDLRVHRGEVVALMGRNGAGKSTVLRHLAGLAPPDAGRVSVGGEAPHQVEPRDLVARVALVPADPGLLLYGSSVAEECELADRESALAPGTTASAVSGVVAEPGLVAEPEADRHPRDLSEGQRLALALGIVLAPEPDLVLLDEPTRGLDYRAKRHLVEALHRLARDGRGVLLATHDVELVAEVASRVVVLADGEVVADGPAREVVAASPMFAPQVAKVLRPAAWLTVGEVREALAG